MFSNKDFYYEKCVIKIEISRYNINSKIRFRNVEYRLYCFKVT